jgi:hypothetical protein
MPEINDVGERALHRADGSIDTARHSFHLVWDTGLTRSEVRQTFNELFQQVHHEIANAPDNQFRKATP